MSSIEDLWKNREYPKWITNHAVFKKLDGVRKVFPSIGLPNFSDTVSIDNKSEIVSFANALLDWIHDSLSKRHAKLTTFAKRGKIGKNRRQALESLMSMMREIGIELGINKAAFITISPNGKMVLSLPSDGIYVGAKKGMGLFKIWEQMNGILVANKFLALPNINKCNQFKNFSSIDIPARELLVKFSSDGADGTWDIATMSERGISSCQSWCKGRDNSGKVIGSMIDPFTAIIYLTADGTKMIRRCIVRYVVDRRKKEPYLLIEKMYPGFDKPSLNAFISVLKKRTELPVLYSGDIGVKASYGGNTKLSTTYIPLSDEMKLLDRCYYPYLDSAILFKADDCKLARNPQTLHQSFKKQVASLFEKAIRTSDFKKTNVKQYGIEATNRIASLRSKK